MKLFRISSCAAAILASAMAFGDTYTHLTTQTVASVGSTAPLEIETTWTFEDTVVDGVSGAKLTSVSPTLYQSVQSIPDMFVTSDGKPLTVIEYGDRVFADSPFITGVTIADTVLKIGDYAFSNCTALAEVELGANLRYLGKRPFINTSVKEITLPDTLLNMDGNPAAGMPFDAKIVISDSSHFSYSDDGLLLLNRDRTRLYACATRAEGFVEIPKTVSEIMPDAFYGCFRLKCLNIPAQITKIGSEAFNVTGHWPQHDAPESTPHLEMVFFQGGDPAAITAADDIFSGTPATLTSYAFDARWSSLQPTWKDRALEINSGKFTTDEFEAEYLGVTWKFRLASDDGVSLYAELWSRSGPCIPASTKASPGSPNAAYLMVPSSLFGFPVNRIGNDAFSGCNVCSTVLLPTSLSVIGDRAFVGCTALSLIGLSAADPDNQLTLPSGVRDLGERPFDGMDKVTTLSIPSSLRNVNGNPLAGCANITAITVSEANRYFVFESPFLMNSDKTVLYACLPTATDVTVPDTVTDIAAYAFENCDVLKTVTFLAPVTGSVPADTFKGLDKVTIRIDINTAADWKSLVDEAPWKELVDSGRFVTYGTSDPTGDAERSETDSATGITWLYRVNGDYATLTGMKRNDADISNLTLPVALGGYTVTNIGSCAFRDILEITRVTIPSAQYRGIGDYAFQGCECLEEIGLNQIRSLGKAPFFDTALVELALPKMLQTVVDNPLDGCHWLQKITVEENNRCFSTDEDGLCLYNAKGTTLIGCCPGAEEITFPPTLKTIRPDAFAGCMWLESIYAECDEPAADVDIFVDTAEKPTIYVDAYTYNWQYPVPATWNGATLSNTGDVAGGAIWTDSRDIKWKYTVSDSVATILSVASASGAPITSLTLPQIVNDRWPVKHLAPCVFSNQLSLTSVSIPNTYNSIGDYAFSNCTALLSISIPTSVRSLGKAPFYGTAITSLAIPNTVTSIDGNPLAGCVFATSISVAEGNPFFSAENGLLFNRSKSVLRAAVPALTEITIPATVTAIQPDAFVGCKTLKAITFLGDEPTVDIADGLLVDTPSSLVVNADACTFDWGDPIPVEWQGRTLNNTGNIGDIMTWSSADGLVWSYSLDNSVATILSVRHADDQPILSATLPQTINDLWPVKHLAPCAFSNQLSLTSVSIPSTYNSIGDYAFSNCTALLSINIPASVRSLGKAPFYGTAITSLAIPNTVTSINGNPLAGCVFATSISVAEGNPFFSANDGMLFNESESVLRAVVPALTEITIPANVAAIQSDAFAGCKALKAITFLGSEPTVDIADGLLTDTPTTLIVNADACAFDWGDPIPATWMNRPFRNIGAAAPVGLQTYTTDDGMTWTYEVVDRGAVIGYGQAALFPMPDGDTLTVPAELDGWPVTTIGADAFRNYTQLKKIEIPATVTAIEPGAFNGMTSLEAFSVSADNPVYSTRYGSLLADKGTTLVKVPATFRFAAETTVISDETQLEVVEILNGVFLSPAALDTTVYTTGVTSAGFSTTVYRFTPALGAETLLKDISSIADYAFADCGFLPGGTVVSGTLTTLIDGTVASSLSGNNLIIPEGTDATNRAEEVTVKTSVGFINKNTASWKTLKLVRSSSSCEVARPEVGLVECSAHAWDLSAWSATVPVAFLPRLTTSASIPADIEAAEPDDAEPTEEEQDCYYLKDKTLDVYCGVNSSIDPLLDSTCAKKVTVKGLPSGLKLVKTTDKLTKISTWTLAGIPTKAGAKQVTMTIVRLDGTKETLTFTLDVQGVTDWLTGEFNGVTYGDDNLPLGSAYAKITNKGALSGKVQIPSEDGASAKTYSFSMKSFDAYDPDSKRYTGTAIMKVGKQKLDVPASCEVASNGTGLLTLDLGSYGTAELEQNAWAGDNTSGGLAGTVFPREQLTFRIKGKGKVTWSGYVIGDNGKQIKVSGTSHLFNDGSGLLLYISPRRNLHGGIAQMVDLGPGE